MKKASWYERLACAVAHRCDGDPVTGFTMMLVVVLVLTGVFLLQGNFVAVIFLLIAFGAPMVLPLINLLFFDQD